MNLTKLEWSVLESLMIREIIFLEMKDVYDENRLQILESVLSKVQRSMKNVNFEILPLTPSQIQKIRRSSR